MLSYVTIVLLTLLIVQFLYLRDQLSRQRRIQQDLKSSEHKYAGILAIAADAIISVDSTCRIVHFNRGAEEIFGRSAAESIGRHLAVLLPPRFRDAHGAHMEMFARSSSTARRMGERREIFGLRADGSEFPAEASISKLVESDGILYTVVLRDISRQKSIESNERFLASASRELTKSLSVDDTLQEVVDLPVPRMAVACILDLLTNRGEYQRLVTSAHRTPQAADLEPVVQHPLVADSPSPAIDVIRRSRMLLADRVDQDWLEGNADHHVVEIMQKLGDHSQLILPFRVSGKTIGALTIIRVGHQAFDDDLQLLAERYIHSAETALANAQLYESARAANAARDNIMNVVSHDLRNPINAVAMCAKALHDLDGMDADARKEVVSTIEEATSWMNRLISDLLDAANIDRGQLALEQRPTNVVAPADRAVHMFSMVAREHHITLELLPDASGNTVNMDSDRIVQVLSNLIRNALNFTPDGGKIAVSVQSRDDGVQYLVRDSGAGISRENIDHIFDRFWQSSDGARTRGSGLGLAISKGIVEAHGGAMWVESEPSHGSTFGFTIPVSSPP